MDARRLSTMMPPRHKKIFDGLFQYDRSWAPHRLSSLVGSFIAYVCSIINQAASHRTPLKRGPQVVNRETSPSLVVITRRGRRNNRVRIRRGFTWRVPKTCGRIAHPVILRAALCRVLPLQRNAPTRSEAERRTEPLKRYPFDHLSCFAHLVASRQAVAMQTHCQITRSAGFATIPPRVVDEPFLLLLPSFARSIAVIRDGSHIETIEP